MIDIGDKIDDRYRVTSRIAHGGMADVYEAYDIVGKRSVALKVMRTDMMGDPKNVDRFHRECIATASLNNPNIVKVFGQGVVDGRPYMANEYVDGRTLRDKLNVVSGHNLPPLEACEVMLQLTSGIQYVHEHGIIHRDIKPDNLFYGTRREAQGRRRHRHHLLLRPRDHPRQRGGGPERHLFDGHRLL
jgi:serine/threonine-protein kinase